MNEPVLTCDWRSNTPNDGACCLCLIPGVKGGVSIAVLHEHEVVFPDVQAGNVYRIEGGWITAAALEKAHELTAADGAGSFTFVAYGAEIPMQVALTQGPTGDVATFTWSCSAATRSLVEAGFLSEIESGVRMIRTPMEDELRRGSRGSGDGRKSLHDADAFARE